MAKAGWTFTRHSYYMVPFVPFMALILGSALSNMNLKLRWSIFSLIFIECLIVSGSHYNIKDNYAYFEKFENELNKLIPTDSKIAINSGFNPTPMYFSHHKGWICFNKNLLDQSYIDTIISFNCEYVVVLKRAFGKDLSLPYQLITENNNYKLYKLP